MSGIYLNASGKRSLKSDGTIVYGGSGGSCCCSLYRIQNACTLSNTSFGVGSVPAAGRYFWGDNYTAQGLTAGVLYYITNTQATGLTDVTMDEDDVFDTISLAAFEGSGITKIAACHNYTRVIESITYYSWVYSHTPDNLNAYYATIGTICGRNTDFDSGGEITAYQAADCVISGTSYFSDRGIRLQIGLVSGKTVRVVAYTMNGFGNPNNPTQMLFLGTGTCPDIIESGDTLTISNTLYASDTPITLANWHLPILPLCSGGTIKLYF